MISQKALTIIVAGVTIGVVAGILLSTDKGSETREKILDKTNDLGNSLQDYFVKLFNGKKKMDAPAMVPSMASDLG